MQQRQELFVFFIAEQRYAIGLSSVERVVRACAVTPLSESPPSVLGFVVIHGRVMPVFDPRVRFGLPSAELTPNCQFIIAQSSKRSCALLVDSAVGIVNCTPTGSFEADELVSGAPSWLSALQKTNDGVIYIHDLESFLSPTEEVQLSSALNQLSEGAKQ